MPADAPPAPGSSRVWFAQALRAVACGLVVLAHYLSFPAAQDGIARLTHTRPLDGLPIESIAPLFFTARWHIPLQCVAVCLFFLVSGFVIPFSLEQGTWRTFAVRRIFRLYPTLWVCALITMTALGLVTHQRGLPFPIAGRDLLPNATLLAPYLASPWIDPAYWTLAIEELFYLVAGFAAAVGLLRSATVVVAFGTLMTAAAVLLPSLPPPSRLIGWTGLDRAPFWIAFNAAFVVFILVGVAAHHAYRRIWRARVAAAVALLLMGLYGVGLWFGPNQFQFADYFASGVAALVIFAIAARFAAAPQGTRGYAASAIDAFANISYPLYLIHMLVGWILLHSLFVLSGRFPVAVLATLVIVVGISSAVHRWVEIPSIELGRRIARIVGGVPPHANPGHPLA